MSSSNQKEKSRLEKMTGTNGNGSYAVLGVVALLLIIAFIKGLGIDDPARVSSF